MAQLSFNLGLAALPETRSKEFPELLRIYNAINIVAAKLDAYTGNTPILDPDQARPLEDTITAGQQTVFDLVCHTSVQPGNLCTIQVVGSESKARVVSFGLYSLATMIALREAAAGEVGRFMLFGLVAYEEGDLEAGQRYVNVGSGYMDSASNVSDAHTKQSVGYALTSKHLWFQPDLNFGAYVAPP